MRLIYEKETPNYISFYSISDLGAMVKLYLLVVCNFKYIQKIVKMRLLFEVQQKLIFFMFSDFLIFLFGWKVLVELNEEKSFYKTTNIMALYPRRAKVLY